MAVLLEGEGGRPGRGQPWRDVLWWEPGARVFSDSCPAMSRVAPEGTRVFATDSAKQAHYLPAILGIEAWFGTTEECVDAAVTGRWRAELP